MTANAKCYHYVIWTVLIYMYVIHMDIADLSSLSRSLVVCSKPNQKWGKIDGRKQTLQGEGATQQIASLFNLDNGLLIFGQWFAYYSIRLNIQIY